MTDCNETHRTRRDVERLVAGELGLQRHAVLREHLRACSPCRAYYDQARSIEEALYPPAALSPAAIDRLADGLLAPTPAAPRRRAWALVPALAAAAALALVWVRGSGDDGFAPRGDGGLDAELPGLSAFVIGAAGSMRRLEASALGAPVDGEDVLQLAYSSAGYAFGAVVGIDAGWDLEWYHDSTPLAQGLRDEPFGGAWKIVAAPGPLRLFALFSDAPIERDAVARAAARLRDAGESVRTADRLPGLDGAQHSLLLVVGR